jgi:hypothetical protein
MASSWDQELRTLSVALPRPGEVLHVDFRPPTGDAGIAAHRQTDPSRPLRVVTVRPARPPCERTFNCGCRPLGCCRLQHLLDLGSWRVMYFRLLVTQVLSQASAKHIRAQWTRPSHSREAQPRDYRQY